MLSTCLAVFCFSYKTWKTASGTLSYLLNFIGAPELRPNYPKLDVHPVLRPESGISTCRMSRQGALHPDKASIYCASIKQRERN